MLTNKFISGILSVIDVGRVSSRKRDFRNDKCQILFRRSQ